MALDLDAMSRRLNGARYIPPGGDPDAAAEVSKATGPVLRFSEWLERELPEPDFLCGTWLSTTSRVLITGPTGLGKTMLGVALAMVTAGGGTFLHWTAGRASRVLYVDGEMSRRQMQRRLCEEGLRSGLEPENLFVLSREDFDEMPPLNTAAGQAWMDVKIEGTKPDLIIFDNIQALVAGDHGKEESWSPVLPWMRSLTKRCVAQIWLHHTGHNEGHSYGTKTREWQMDTCILMKRVADESDDLTFSLEFTKARERTPENRAEFDDVTIALRDDRWQLGKGDEVKKGTRVPEGARVAFNLLKKAMDEAGERPPASNHIPGNVQCVKVSLWEKYCKQGTITKGETEDAFRKAFGRAGEKLQVLGLIQVWGEFVWIT